MARSRDTRDDGIIVEVLNRLNVTVAAIVLEVLGADMQRPPAERVVTFRLVGGRIERDTTFAALPLR